MSIAGELQVVYMALKSAELRADRHERLACLGEMATGIAHEINNPLTYVSFNLASLGSEIEWLSGHGRESVGGELASRLSDCQDILRDSCEGVERIQEIVRNLKDFAYDRAPRLEYFDVCKNIEASLKLVWNEVKHKAEVIKEFEALPQVLGYPKQLNQVFINLIVNAAQAISGRGKIVITAKRRESSVCVQIEDNGCGIPEAFQDRIFDSFFTTKPSGEGTGLGLGVVREIVKRHRGDIAFSSEEGKGTVFSVTLPVAHPDLEKAFAKQKKGEGLCTKDASYS